MALVTKFRVYVETTIIADWLLVETVSKRRRNVLSSEVMASHELISFLLRRKDDIILPFTSYWSIFESVGVIKRTNIEVWLVHDGIPTSFYYELRDDKEYRLEDFQIKKIKSLIRSLTIDEKKNKPLKLLPEQSDIDFGLSLILNENLEAPDSFHLGIALSYGCDFFVTKDKHYRRCAKFLSENKIKIMRPQRFIKALKDEGFSIPSDFS